MIHLLGPVELSGQEQPPRLRSDKARLVLASLAADLGRPVSLDALVHRLWEDYPPRNPRENVHVYISRLRRTLRSLGPQAHLAIVQRAHTYVLEADPDLIDWHLFHRLVSRADQLAGSGDDSAALARLHEAEALWRGTPLAGLPGAWAASRRTAMEAQHRGCTTFRFAVELRLGRYAKVASEAAALVEQHPTDETLVGQFMIACYGSGRHTDALSAYRRSRQVLREEHGADIGEELAGLHQRILGRAPVAELARPGVKDDTPQSATTAATDNLPRHVPLVGRHREMHRLRSAALSDPQRSPAIVVESLSGMAGVGKTCLALHAAHELRELFPGGRLYLNLRAHTASGRPMSAQTALGALLRLAGVAAEQVPTDLDARSAMWRQHLTENRTLVVLDDAAGPEQVRPLLPDAPPSLTLITSRSRMVGLAAVARSLPLDVLPEEDAVDLFRTLTRAGAPERGDLTGEAAEREELAGIVQQCGYLPLAIELTAGRLAAHPSWTLRELSARLEHAPLRLVEIRDGYREIAGAFAMSYQTLPPEQRSAFCRLSLHTGPDFGPHAAAVLLGRPLAETERILESLLTGHLVQEPTPHRFRYHDLLGEYARTLCATPLEDVPERHHGEDDGDTHGRAVRRLADFYVHTAAHCAALLRPAPGPYPPQAPPATEDAATRAPSPGTVESASGPEVPPPPAGTDTPEGARRWFTLELDNLLATHQHARTHGMPERAALLADGLAGYLDAEAHWAEAVPMHQHAAQHWESAGNRHALCRSLLDLSAALSRTAGYVAAEEAGRAALELARQEDDAATVSEALRVLGVLHWHMGEHRIALRFHTESLRLCAPLGDPLTEARCRNNIGITQLYLGEHDAALRNFQEALVGFRAVGDTRNFGKTLNNLGDLYRSNGDTDAARQAYQEALHIAERTGSRADVAITQANIAEILIGLGEPEESADKYGFAFRAFRALGDRKNEAAALGGLGRAHFAAGNRDAALEHARRSVALAREIGAVDEEAQALRLTGEVELSRGRASLAVDHLLAALASARRSRTADEVTRIEELLGRARRAAERPGEV